MIILPAIDILDGRCVRLCRGEYGSASQVAEDAVETAKKFEADGASMLHTVDLNGAKDGSATNFCLFEKIAAAVKIPIEVGGGIRNIETVKRYFDAGISRVILGTAALRDRRFTEAAIAEFGDKIAVGIDAKSGKVCVSGWCEGSDVDYIDFALEMRKIGVQNIIFTDIDRDGTLSEPNFGQLAALSEKTNIKITASGGIKNIEQIKKLTAMGLYAAICGKSIYEGTLNLREAIRVGEGR